MPAYRVVWEIDIEADTPLDAARAARLIQLDPANIAYVFDVFHGSVSLYDETASFVRVDLEDESVNVFPEL